MPFPNIAFISGPSFVGKSTIARRIAKMFGVLHIDLDAEHGEYCKGKKIPYPRSLWHSGASKEQCWEYECIRSEFVIPMLLDVVARVPSDKKVLLDGNYIVPHVAASYGFSGVYLIHPSHEQMFDRMRKRFPKFNTASDEWIVYMLTLQWYSGRRVAEEALMYGYNVYDTDELAMQDLLNLLRVYT